MFTIHQSWVLLSCVTPQNKHLRRRVSNQLLLHHYQYHVFRDEEPSPKKYGENGHETLSLEPSESLMESL